MIEEVRRAMVLACVALVACGRYSFDALPAGDGGGRGDVLVDSVLAPAHVAYLKASNGDPGDQFGESLALSRDGRTLAVGAPLESSLSTVINSGTTDNSALEAGAVYVFRLGATTWTQEAYIKAANAEAGDQFGWGVALSADGSTLVVGARHEDGGGDGPGATPDNAASNAGAAYVFVRSNSTWSQQSYLKATASDAGDQYGERVAISDDGNTVAVGAANEDSNATTINGNAADNSSADSGAAYVYVRAGTVWSAQAYVKAFNADPGDWFGYKLSLSASGDLLAVGAYREDSAATGIDGNGNDNSLTNGGAAYLLMRSGNTWSQAVYLKAANTNNGDDFGYNVALSGDGSFLGVTAEGEASANGDPLDNSAPASGALYAFRSGPWTQSGYFKAPNRETNDEMGYALATSMTGTRVLVGAPFEQSAATGIDGNGADNSLTDAGAAYMFTTSGTESPHYLKAPNTSAGDQFGWWGAMSGDGSIYAISAPYEDGSGRGVDAPYDEAATDSGAVYVYY